MSYIWDFSWEQYLVFGRFLGSGLNDIFHLYAHLEIVSRSFVRSLTLFSLFLTTENREVLCQTLLKAFEMSKNIERTFSERLQSNKEIISWVMISNWFTHESDGQKLDWFALKSFSISRKK